MTPGEATMRAAAAYERGLKPVSHLIDVADEQTAIVCAPPPALPERIVWLPAVLMIMPRIGPHAVFARTVLLAERRWNPSGDIAELIAIHQGLFEGVFEDAGKLRTSNATREVTERAASGQEP